MGSACQKASAKRKKGDCGILCNIVKATSSMINTGTMLSNLVVLISHGYGLTLVSARASAPSQDQSTPSGLPRRLNDVSRKC